MGITLSRAYMAEDSARVAGCMTVREWKTMYMQKALEAVSWIMDRKGERGRKLLIAISLSRVYMAEDSARVAEGMAVREWKNMYMQMTLEAVSWIWGLKVGREKAYCLYFGIHSQSNN